MNGTFWDKKLDTFYFKKKEHTFWCQEVKTGLIKVTWHPTTKSTIKKSQLAKKTDLEQQREKLAKRRTADGNFMKGRYYWIEKNVKRHPEVARIGNLEEWQKAVKIKRQAEEWQYKNQLKEK